LTADQPDEAVVSWLDKQDDASLYVSAVTLGELCFGIERLQAGKKRMKLQTNLDRMKVRFSSRVIPFDAGAAEAWAIVRRRAEDMKRTMPAIDAMLAATAELHEMTLVTRNVRDFEGWGGPVLNPWEPQPSTA
jgi:predicted nucleic acid-binding protein